MGRWAEQFLTTARERGLDRIAAGYAVCGWLLVQAASIALPAYQAPNWLLRWLIASAILGFPIALTAAWIWNRRRQGSSTGVGRREALVLALIAVVGILTLGELAWHWSAQPSAQFAQGGFQPALGSIAVLPFANTSGDPKQVYFSEGLSEELIGLLARNSALRVAARTSSFFFEGKNEDIRSIAEKLNVRTVLEGNVRTENGRVRIEADLINAADGYQLWSESYDRSLSDILMVQEDIANAIAAALEPRLLGQPARERLPKARSIDPVAYRLYLEGQFEMGHRTRDGEKRALDIFRQVAKLAPDFADGQAALAYDLLLVGKHTNDPQLIPERTAALAAALRLDPTNPLALTLAITLAVDAWQWDQAIEDARILQRTNPNNAQALFGLASTYEAFGMEPERTAAWQQAAQLDPFSYIIRINLADTFEEEGHFVEDQEAYTAAMKLNPGLPEAMDDMCEILALQKKMGVAKSILASLTVAGETDTFDCRYAIAWGSGDVAATRQLAEQFAKDPGEQSEDPVAIALYLSGAGELDRALDWYEKAFDRKIPIFNIANFRLIPRALFQSPRWIALTKRPEFVRWSQARERAIRELGCAGKACP